MNSNQIDFTTFVLSISSAAFMGLQKTEKDFEMAKHNIDLLELLKDKTKNNLSKEEERLIDNLLYETRMRFVEAQKGSKK